MHRKFMKHITFAVAAASLSVALLAESASAQQFEWPNRGAYNVFQPYKAYINGCVPEGFGKRAGEYADELSQARDELYEQAQGYGADADWWGAWAQGAGEIEASADTVGATLDEALDAPSDAAINGAGKVAEKFVKDKKKLAKLKKRLKTCKAVVKKGKKVVSGVATKVPDAISGTCGFCKDYCGNKQGALQGEQERLLQMVNELNGMIGMWNELGERYKDQQSGGGGGDCE